MSEAKRAIKKYPNRRLYDTQASSYITLGDIRQMVLDGVDIHIEDARTHEDLTRCVLMQILVEDESASRPILGIDALVNLIRCREQYDQALLAAYIERNLQLFSILHEKIGQQKEALQQPTCDGTASVNWGDFLNAQTPALQHMMTSYLEQTAHMFMNLQTQMRERGGSLKAG